ncbi:GH19268 [Drosophila grimshawi]|uniref:carboxylesterase n=2 Tax=Drosophila grimshawi TaxID=7222 RepID=B4JF84_DROGR|nr:GH19268 [Drosophila grimshawi]
MLKYRRMCNRTFLQLLTGKLNYSQSVQTKIVELPLGKVKGKHQAGIAGQAYYSFEGIPFGKPPIGQLRFQPTQPAEPWCGKILDCLKERDRPVQVNKATGKIMGSEDCLHLNVYTKHFGKPRLPVLVYIHGGGFCTGGATRIKYGPDYLMREDFVYVQFSYRLCALGFLSLSCAELGVLGNAGLHDQLLALRWIQKYVSYFNGDPENVTLMGTSAGAGSVHFMMCLPEACGLFHRAIIMSGSMLSPWVQVPDTSTLFCRLARQKGYNGLLAEAPILEYLCSLPAGEVVQHNLFGARQYIFGHLYPFVPGLEHHTTNKSDEGLLKRPFLELMRNAWSKRVPLLIGANSFEGLVMYPYCTLNNGLMMDLLKLEPDLVLPYDLYERLSKKEREERALELIHFHFGPRNIDKNDVMQVLDLFSYKLFWHGIHRAVLSRLAYAQAPTYVYRFDFDSPDYNLMRIKLCGNDIKQGVCHADELGYIFPRRRALMRPLNTAECGTIGRMVGILTTFARTGNPNCAETGDHQWMPVDKKDPFKAMNIGREVEFQSLLEKNGLKVWNKLYDNDNRLLFEG